MARTSPPPWVVAVLVAAGVVVVQALLVPLFAGIAASSEPRDLPVLVAGPAPAADQFAAQLTQASPGRFEITRVDTAAAADAALRDREGYAAFVLGPDGVALHTASAASPVVAQLLRQASTELSPAGEPVPVVDVVPGSPDDPRGAGFAAGFLPLALTSMLAGIGLTFAVPGRQRAERSGAHDQAVARGHGRQSAERSGAHDQAVARGHGRGARLIGLAGYAVLAGLAGAAVLQGWLGVLGGDYLANAAAIGLFALATAGIVLGLGAALGEAGVGLGALLAFLVGNPLSAVAAAPELLPQPWGMVGQWLPPGAGGTLLRSVAWFDGAGAAQPIWLLAGYAAVGVALVLLGRARLRGQEAVG